MDRLAVLLLAALTVTCGGGELIRGARGSRGSSEEPVILFAPKTEASQVYSPIERLSPPTSPLIEAVLREVRNAARSVSVPAPEPDARLYHVARELAPLLSADEPLDPNLLQFTLQRHGVVEPDCQLLAVWGPLDGGALQLESRVSQVLASERIRRVGVGAVARRRGTGVILLILQPSYIDLRPIPRAVRRGEFVKLIGRIRKPFTRPKVFVTRADGTVAEPRLFTGSDGFFRLAVPCEMRGRQQIEVTAEGRGGTTVLANFPVWCGRRPPRSIAVETSTDGDFPAITPGQAEQHLVELVNRDRAHYELAPLQVHSDVAAIARAYSEEMRATGVIAHVSPLDGSSPATRVRRVGIEAAAVLENVARAYGIGQTQAQFMKSPGHRANILFRDATHIGVGVALGQPVGGGKRELFVTQLIIRLAARIDTEAEAARLRAHLAQTVGLDHDQDLGEFAAALARSLATGLAAEQASRRAATSVPSVDQRFRSRTVHVATLAAVDQFTIDSTIASPGASHFGLAVAQGDDEVVGRDAIYVVLVTAQAM